jgi:hypothetical protein
MLSFLGEFEKAIFADIPQPLSGGDWSLSRTVNYETGIARLLIADGDEKGVTKPTGSILLQSSRLADGSLCLRVHLRWETSPPAPVHSIMTKPGIDWVREARTLASLWAAGLPEDTETDPGDDTYRRTG